MDSVRVLISLGSNIGDRLGWIQKGLDLWRRAANVTILGHSRVYESPPVGDGIYTADFLNAAIALDTTLTSTGIINLCHRIENECGRDREKSHREGHDNRTLDCDIIFYGKHESNGPNMRIPHPDWQDRAFVVKPLVDLERHLDEWQSVRLSEILPKDFPENENARVYDGILS